MPCGQLMRNHRRSDSHDNQKGYEQDDDDRRPDTEWEQPPARVMYVRRRTVGVSGLVRSYRRSSWGVMLHAVPALARSPDGVTRRLVRSGRIRSVFSYRQIGP